MPSVDPFEALNTGDYVHAEHIFRQRITDNYATQADIEALSFIYVSYGRYRSALELLAKVTPLSTLSSSALYRSGTASIETLEWTTAVEAETELMRREELSLSGALEIKSKMVQGDWDSAVRTAASLPIGQATPFELGHLITQLVFELSGQVFSPKALEKHWEALNYSEQLSYVQSLLMDGNQTMAGEVLAQFGDKPRCPLVPAYVSRWHLLHGRRTSAREHALEAMRIGVLVVPAAEILATLDIRERNTSSVMLLTSSVLAENPANHICVLRRSHCLSLMKKRREAYAELRKLLLRNPLERYLWIHGAVAAWRAGKFQSGIKLLSKRSRLMHSVERIKSTQEFARLVESLSGV